ncbi:Putative exopolyphosphatase [Corynebacterium glyciniphilum AJ 3170]|uniref:Putative exopolyphosphatase n=1 Tax=Corynebacterium glyciniphilum AJ 3170 TaxID=1404245 RepID=X5E7R8_9CORY|nr:Ppx/GppA phosphatase family protein [Corynebacterium glyciniphilum]AHW63480.1 Putative exopolyphosphatase [Corynebacterium glyciniphilum AJ 3170]
MTGTYAAIDCGTNSIRLLISEVLDDGTLREINRDNIIVRLGQGVDATGRFADAALDRVDEALGIYADRMIMNGVTDVMMGATSATRDAENREDFFAITRRHLGRVAPGVQAEVVTGIREAQLSFAGAVADMESTDGHICVIDLGGGSTEFVVDAYGEGSGQAYSADMGCVRLTERYLHTVPPTDEEIAEARGYVDGLMATVEENVDLDSVTRVVGVAGTVTTVAAIQKGLTEYNPEKTHMSEIDLADFRSTARSLLGETVEQRREHPAMHPGRADVIGGGAIVIDAFASRFLDKGLTSITVSEKDILDGILAEVIERNS